MTKPEDIPQDVWDASMATVRAWPGNLTIGELVARAILAAKAEEREACANLAMASIGAGDENHETWLERYDVAISIASAIRRLSHER